MEVFTKSSNTKRIQLIGMVFLSILAFLLPVFSLITTPFTFRPIFAGGDGSLSSPYLIATAEQFKNSASYNSYFELISDIRLTSSINSTGIIYAKYNGNNHCLTLGSEAIKTTGNNRGLFPIFNGYFLNFHINLYSQIDFNQSAISNFGIIAGINNGAISNCIIESNNTISLGLSSNNNTNIKAGVVAGMNTGSISYNSCSVSINCVSREYREQRKDIYIGGIVGETTTPIIACTYLDRSITLGLVVSSEEKQNSNVLIGGIAGQSSASISQCRVNSSIYAEQKIISSSDWLNIKYNASVGGIVEDYSTSRSV